MSVEQAGVYVVELRGRPVSRNRNRWFLWIEDENGRRISDQRMFEPFDFSLGTQTVRCYLRCPKPVGTATIFMNDLRISTNVLDGRGLRAIGTRAPSDAGAASRRTT